MMIRMTTKMKKNQPMQARIETNLQADLDALAQYDKSQKIHVIKKKSITKDHNNQYELIYGLDRTFIQKSIRENLQIEYFEKDHFVRIAGRTCNGYSRKDIDEIRRRMADVLHHKDQKSEK